MSRNVSHEDAKKLGQIFNLSDRQRGAIYEYLQAMKVIAKTGADLKEAEARVDALRLQECVLSREMVSARIRLTSAEVHMDVIKSAEALVR